MVRCNQTCGISKMNLYLLCCGLPILYLLIGLLIAITRRYHYEEDTDEEITYQFIFFIFLWLPKLILKGHL